MKFKYVAEPLYENYHEVDGVQTADAGNAGSECCCEYCVKYPAGTIVYRVRTNIRLRKPEVYRYVVDWCDGNGFINYTEDDRDKVVFVGNTGKTPAEAVQVYIKQEIKVIKEQQREIDFRNKYISSILQWITMAGEIVNE